MVPAAALRFVRSFEVALPGLPAVDSLQASTDGASIVVRTSAAAYVLDALTGALRGPETPSPSGSGKEGSPPSGQALPPAVNLCAGPQGSPPGWLAHLPARARAGICVPGPDETIALLSAEGTVFGRDRRHGHVLWRHVAAGRISRAGVALGPYLVIAADSSRTLEAIRWSDGTTAGLFRLESEDACVASAPLVLAGRIYILAVQAPRAETRVLALQSMP